MEKIQGTWRHLCVAARFRLPTKLNQLNETKMKKLYLILPDGEKIYCAYGEECKLQEVIVKCAFNDGSKFLIQAEDRTCQEDLDKLNEALLTGEWK